MCGIAGEIRFDSAPAPVAAIRAINDYQARRGPDAEGIVDYGRVVLGHRRLKIVDLSDRASQPMVDDDLGLSIVFNGCIYNHDELRESLRGHGYRFFSHSDTEVILKAFHRWGESCVSRLNGMFAFAIYDHASGNVFMARDRLGIKPLYYVEGKGFLRFASSLTALAASSDSRFELDPRALHHYMTFHSVVPAPYTILKSIKKLPPATRVTIGPKGDKRFETYWRLGFSNGRADIDFEDAKQAVLDALTLAVRRRLTGDVPVGVLLSGGLDSSLITGLLARNGATGLNTFSVGFEGAGGEEGNEFKYSDVVADAFGTTHHRIHVDADMLLEHLPDCFAAMSEPMTSHDNIGFYLLSREVSKHVKVVQSGQGADEVFGGYHWYPPLLDEKTSVDDYREAFFDREHSEFREAVQRGYVNGDYSAAFVRRFFFESKARRTIDKALHLDTTVMLVDDPVKRVDNMTMAWGLEARVPFLDHEVVELAFRLPAEQKVANSGKYVLKEAAREVIPNEVIDRPKGYFPVPGLKFLSGPYLEFVHDVINSQVARQRGLFRSEYLDKLLDAPTEHITPLQGSKLWQVASLEYWLQTHGL